MSGHSDVVVGAQFGDEGKGRVIDNNLEGRNINLVSYLPLKFQNFHFIEDMAYRYDINARFNGGPNAGHTLVYNGMPLALSGVPSGVLYNHIELYVGSGCVVNPVKMLAEIMKIKSLGLPLEGRLHISDEATAILPSQIFQDEITGGEIGTTKNGIGPAYADQALRSIMGRLKNIRLSNLLDRPLEARRDLIENYREVARIYGQECGDIASKADEAMAAMDQLRPYINRNPLWLDDMVRSGKNVLFEGAQASMLDVTKGTVPHVTSSHTIAGFAYVGGDLAPKYHRKVFGVAKMIMSRVGNGPFPSEFGGLRSEQYCDEKFCDPNDGKTKHKHVKESEEKDYSAEKMLYSSDPFEVGIGLRMLGKEYGAVTKRPRRIGMFDLVALMHHCRVNGVDELYLTKFDCLHDFAQTNLPGIPIVTGYSLDGQNIRYLPGSNEMLRKVTPIVEYFPHITQDLSGMRDKRELPKEAKGLLKYIENYTGCRVAWIGVGPDREQFIKLP